MFEARAEAKGRGQQGHGDTTGWQSRPGVGSRASNPKLQSRNLPCRRHGAIRSGVFGTIPQPIRATSDHKPHLSRSPGDTSPLGYGKEAPPHTTHSWPAFPRLLAERDGAGKEVVEAGKGEGPSCITSVCVCWEAALPWLATFQGQTWTFIKCPPKRKLVWPEPFMLEQAILLGGGAADPAVIQHADGHRCQLLLQAHRHAGPRSRPTRSPLPSRAGGFGDCSCCPRSNFLAKRMQFTKPAAGSTSGPHGSLKARRVFCVGRAAKGSTRQSYKYHRRHCALQPSSLARSLKHGQPKCPNTGYHEPVGSRRQEGSTGSDQLWTQLP